MAEKVICGRPRLRKNSAPPPGAPLEAERRRDASGSSNNAMDSLAASGCTLPLKPRHSNSFEHIIKILPDTIATKFLSLLEVGKKLAEEDGRAPAARVSHAGG